MRVALLLVVVLTAGCQTRQLPAPTSSLSSPESYFPLEVGATWVRKAGDGGTITARVVAQKTVGSATCTVIETKTARDDRERVTRVCYEATPSQVRVVETEGGGRRAPLES